MGSSHGGAQGTVRCLGERKREQEEKADDTEWEKEVKEKMSACRDFGLQHMRRDRLLCRLGAVGEKQRKQRTDEITMGNENQKEENMGCG